MESWELLKTKIKEEQISLERSLRELQSLRSAPDEELGLVDDLQAELKAKLDRIDDLAARMTEAANGNTTRQAHVLRIREMSVASKAEIARLSRGFVEHSTRSQLFGKSRRSSGSNESVLLKERAALLSSRTMIDEALETANRAQTMIRGQTARFVSASEKLSDIVNKMPLAQNLISKIQSIRFRDKFILALVIATGIFTFLWIKIL